MVRRTTKIKNSIPLRRNVVRWEGGSDSPPELLRRRPSYSSPRPRFGSPRSGSGFFSFLFRLLLIPLSIGVVFGAKWLVDRFFFPPLLGAAPEYFPETVAAIRSPDTTFPFAAHAIRKIRKGDSVKEIASAFGIDDGDSQELGEIFRKSDNADEEKSILRPGHVLEFEFDTAGILQNVMTEPVPGRRFLVERNPEGRFSAQTHTIVAERGERVAVGNIESSFAAAATKAGVRYDIVDDLVDLFSNRVEFKRDFQVGDRFTVIYRDLVLSDGRAAGGSEILAAALEVNGEHLVAARYVGTDGKARFFDEKGQLLGNTFLRYPLKFSRISSLFSGSRFHPVLKFKRPHNGVDFAAPSGTPVRSVADGTVEFAGRNGGSGIMVKIRHNDRYSTAYLHLSNHAKNLRRGVRVRRGDLIGAVGQTGLATGPHLHFSFYDNGKYIDPLKIKLPTLDSLDPGTKIDATYLKRVIFTLDHYQTVELEHFYTE